MRILILDDDLTRHQDFARRYAGHERLHVATVDQFESALSRGPFQLVHLDHDLGDYVRGMSGIEYERTGVEAAKMLAACRWCEDEDVQVIIHSWNPEGARRMRAILTDAGLSAILEPFEYWGEAPPIIPGTGGDILTLEQAAEDIGPHLCRLSTIQP